jgi:membrane-bound lytic murein transglycosylase B
LSFDYPKRGKFFQGQLKEYLHLVREEKVDVTSLKGSYAGAMGFGQFIPSSFRNFAVDFDGDGKRDIWKNKTDAIGSVANYFARHHWKAGEPVVGSVVFNQPAQEDWFSKGLKPELTLGQWKDKGAATSTSLSADAQATLMRLKVKGGEQYWFGLHNFYVITRYNHSKLYAMAVYRLSEQIKSAMLNANSKTKVASK